jgi:PAS domain S-box-containing protein
LALLHKVRAALASELDLSVLFRTVVEAIADTFGYTLVSLYLLQEDVLVLQHQVGYDQVIERIPITQGIIGRVTRTGEAVLLKDVHTDATFLEAIEGIISEVSEVCVPLFDQGRVVGVLNVESSKGMTLDEADLRVMTALSEHVNVAIGRARLYAEVRESKDRYKERQMYLEAVLGAAPDAIVTLDAHHRIVEWSPGAERLFGYSQQEVMGQNLDHLITNPDTFEEAVGLTQIIMSGKDVPPAEIVRYRKDGSPVNVHSGWLPDPDRR